MSIVTKLKREIESMADFPKAFTAGCTLSAYHLGVRQGLARALALAQQQEAQRAVSRISTAAAPDSGGYVEPSSD